MPNFRSYKDMVDFYGYDPNEEEQDYWRGRIQPELTDTEAAIVAELNADLEAGLEPGLDAPDPVTQEDDLPW